MDEEKLKQLYLEFIEARDKYLSSRWHGIRSFIYRIAARPREFSRLLGSERAFCENASDWLDLQYVSCPNYMNIEQELINGFGLTSDVVVAGDYIEQNDDLMRLKGKIDYMVYVPSYMLWCVRHKELDGNLVCDRTINAISEFGRANDPDVDHLNFKYLCNNNQKSVVSGFLNWALVNLELCDEKQIKRSLKHW